MDFFQKSLLIIGVSCLLSCTTEKGIQDIFLMSNDTLIVKTDERFLSEYFSSFVSVQENRETVFYGFNHTRRTIDRINLSSGELDVLKPCDTKIEIPSNSSITVFNNQLIIQSDRQYQWFQIDIEKNCLSVIANVDSRNLAGLSVIEAGLVVSIAPTQKPVLLGDELILPMYSMDQSELPKLLKINFMAQTITQLPIDFPKELKESLMPYLDLCKPLVNANENNSLSFIFPFSDLIFRYNTVTENLEFKEVSGQNINGQIELPTQKEDLRVWMPFNSNYFQQFLWDAERKVYYRIEIKKPEDEKKRGNEVFFDHHYITVISEDLELIKTFKVPENCYSTPIPIGDRLYFMMRQNIDENAIMFLGIPNV